MIGAIVFDFDGVIFDTETPLYHAWRLTYEHYGCEPIELDEWADTIGRDDADEHRLEPFRRLGCGRFDSFWKR